jgi:hypothetical protein
MNKALQKILTDPPKRSGQRCRVCGSPELAADVVAWVKAREGGSLTSLQCFYQGYVDVQYRGAFSVSSLRGHVARCLRRDVSGKPL